MSPNASRVAGVILAAGESRRMGRDKPLLPWGGQTFLEHIADVLSGEVYPLIVVLGHHADQIEHQARLPAAMTILRNSDYSLGQLSSLHVALRSLVQQPIDAAIICLVDHPAITKPVLRALLTTFEQNRAPVLIPSFHGRRGHPVLFSKELFQELLDAPMDQGARSVVRIHQDEIRTVEVDEEGILWDVDRPEDYEALQRRWPTLTRSGPPPSE